LYAGRIKQAPANVSRAECGVAKRHRCGGGVDPECRTDLQVVGAVELASSSTCSVPASKL
jgi:hypothetical protein